MGSARGLRLREALEEFVAGFTGDTGTRRHGGVHHQISQADRELVETAQGLLGRLNGDSSTDPAQRDTPGSRARDRASTGTTEGSSNDRARGMWPGASTPAGSAGTEGGVSS